MQCTVASTAKSTNKTDIYTIKMYLEIRVYCGKNTNVEVFLKKWG